MKCYELCSAGTNFAHNLKYSQDSILKYVYKFIQSKIRLQQRRIVDYATLFQNVSPMFLISHFSEDRYSSIWASCKVGVRPIMDRYEAKLKRPTTFTEDPRLLTLIEIRVNNFGDEIYEVTSRQTLPSHCNFISYALCQ